MKALAVLSLLVSVNVLAAENEVLEQKWNTEEVVVQKVINVGGCEIHQDAMAGSIIRGSIPLAVCERVKVKTMGRFKILDQTKWLGLRNVREDRVLGETEIARTRVLTKETGTLYVQEGQSPMLSRVNAQNTCEAHKEALLRQAKADTQSRDMIDCLTQALTNQP